ncbi:MAG: tRNA pseudouridine(55) synthase TruB [Mycobacteriales bacterium]
MSAQTLSGSYSGELRSGLCIVDKPAGMTSHDVVAKLRRIVGTRKVGHAGTLDPMATGVLVAGVGKATRLLGYISGTTKNYSATIRLGQTTLTDDREGPVQQTVSTVLLDAGQVQTAIRKFVGAIDQVPAAVSAIKRNGRRAYERVRAGEAVELAARRVHVSGFEAVAFRRSGAFLDVDVEVECSSGTYIRSLARDLGAVLGVGGHLRMLRRTRVGAFSIEVARSLEELLTAQQPVAIELSAAVAGLLPRRELDVEQTAKLRHGVALSGVGQPGPYGAFDPMGAVVALLHELPDDAAALARPLVVFSAA